MKQAAKSRLQSTGQSLLQKAIIGMGPPGERSIKRAAKRKNPDVVRRSYGTHRNTSSVKNGSSTPKLFRMYKIRIGFVWSTIDSDQCGIWLLGAKRTDIGLDGPRSLLICSQWSWRRLHRSYQYLLFCGSTYREYRWF